jgi:hypothetical protein
MVWLGGDFEVNWMARIFPMFDVKVTTIINSNIIVQIYRAALILNHRDKVTRSFY